MINSIQILARVFYRAFVIAMIILMWNPKYIWGVPLGVIIGMCSEAKSLTEIKK